jgi:hypothetical protein
VCTHPNKEALEGFGDFKTRHVIRTVKHAYGLVLLAKEEAVLLGMSDRMNVGGGGGTKVMRISRQPSPVQLENVEYFNYVGSMITNDVRCARHIIPRIAVV